MNFTESVVSDIEQLSEWIKNDPYHKDCRDPEWWLTGNGFISYCLQDEKGPTMYVRIDRENDLMRLHTQFAPVSEVSKRRVIASLRQALPKMESLGIANGMKGFVYKSTSPLLIEYMKRQFGFQAVGNDDHELLFGE